MHDYRVPVRGLLLFVCLVHVCCTEDSLPQYKCHEDHCNLHGQPQFCSTTYRRCQNCKDVKEKCSTPEQPLNCTKFCVGLEVNKRLKEEKEKECKPLGQITHGRHNGSSTSPVKQGDTIEVTCHPNYILPLGSLYTCGQYGLWKPTEPTCLFAGAKEYLGYKTATICLGIFLGLCFMVMVVQMCKYLKYKSKYKRAKAKMKEVDLLNNRPAEQVQDHHPIDKPKQIKREHAATRPLDPREVQPFLEDTHEANTTEPKLVNDREDESIRYVPADRNMSAYEQLLTQSRGVSDTHPGIINTDQTRDGPTEQQSSAQGSAPQQEQAQPRPELPQFYQLQHQVATPTTGNHPPCAPSTLCVPDSSSGFPFLADVGNHTPDTPEEAGGKVAMSRRDIDLDDMKRKNHQL